MEKVTRRAFIGGMGAILATGAVAMSGCAPKDDGKQAELSATGSDQSEAPVPDETLEFDIAVVGAGCSGLAACVQAAESGASVICIEAKSIAGGAAGGVEGLFAVNSQIQKDQNITVSMGEMIRTELEQNQYRNSGLVLRDLVKASGEDIDWLVSKGVRFGKVDNYVGFHPIFHWFETGTGAESYIVPMNETAVGEGVEFLFDTHADELICDEGGSVVGLFATKADGNRCPGQYARGYLGHGAATPSVSICSPSSGTPRRTASPRPWLRRARAMIWPSPLEAPAILRIWACSAARRSPICPRSSRAAISARS